MSRSCVYSYFPTKGAIASELVRRCGYDIENATGPYVNGRGRTRQRIHVAVARVCGVVRRDAALLTNLQDFINNEPEGTLAWTNGLDRAARGIASRMAHDQRLGIAKTHMPPVRAAQALVGLLVTTQLSNTVPADWRGDSSVAVAAELWWRAIYVKHGARMR